MDRLASLVGDRISARLVPEIEILPWRRSQVLALKVCPSPSRPHCLIREGPTAGQDPRRRYFLAEKGPA